MPIDAVAGNPALVDYLEFRIAPANNRYPLVQIHDRTSAFRLKDRACGAHKPSRLPALGRTKSSSPTQQLSSSTTHPISFRTRSSSYNGQICRTLRRRSLERASGRSLTTARRLRSGTPWTTNRNPRKSVGPLNIMIESSVLRMVAIWGILRRLNTLETVDCGGRGICTEFAFAVGYGCVKKSVIENQD